MALGEPQRRMKMSPRWRTVCAAASATEVVSLWRSQSPLTSMTGTLGSSTNCSLREVAESTRRRFSLFEASDAARWKGVARWKFSIPAVVVWTYIRRVLPHVCYGLRPRGRAVKRRSASGPSLTICCSWPLPGQAAGTPGPQSDLGATSPDRLKVFS